jgi:hypothetical protein
MSKDLFAELRQEDLSTHAIKLKDVNDFIFNLANDVKDGFIDPIVALKTLSDLSKGIDEYKKEVYEIALKEAEKYSEKTFEHQGVKVEKRNGSRLWNFKGIQEWNDLNESRKSKEELYKSAFDNYAKGVQMVDENGEQVPIPVVTYGKDVLVLK